MIYADFFQVLADIVGAILGFLQNIVSPIGEFMVMWINYVLVIFPENNLIPYIVLCIIIVISAIIVNSYWSGDKQPKHLKEKGISFASTGEDNPL